MLMGLFDNVTEIEYLNEDLGPGAVLLRASHCQTRPHSWH